VLLPTQNLAKNEKYLVKVYKGLCSQDQESLLAFAQFLAERTTTQEESPPTPQERVDIPRPEDESVVAAIKRLSLTYPMVDRSLLLTETSSIMTAHVMHGKTAELAVDELEVLFSKYYQQHQLDQK